MPKLMHFAGRSKMAEWAWLNGEVVATDAIRLSVSERGFLLGETAFETMRWSDGAIRRWHRHRERCEAGLAYLGINGVDFDQIERAARDLVGLAGLDEAVLRLTVGGGASTSFDQDISAKPTILLTVRPRPEPPTAMRLALLATARRAPVPSNQFKLGGYADNSAARREAKAMGADMAVMCDSDGNPVCCDVANLFWVDPEGRVYTPSTSAGALPGTTRAALLAASKRAGVTIEDAESDTPGLDQAVAALVTNAVIGAVPVASLDGRALDTEHAVIRALVEMERVSA